MLIVLGAGVTGLAVSHSSQSPAFEASCTPGGICSSYYTRPGTRERLNVAPKDEEVYRFELGGGHWIFGGEPAGLKFIDSLSPVQHYHRLSAVYFREDDLYVDYPIQNNLRFMPEGFARNALSEISRTSGPFTTMKEWLLEHFGPTLCNKFFFPFHELYTAGLYTSIVPQDAYKSPINLAQVIGGTSGKIDSIGYNVTFAYPREGLNSLAQRLASHCDIRYGKRATRIDTKEKVVFFEDGFAEKFNGLISTLPQNATATTSPSRFA